MSFSEGMPSSSISFRPWAKISAAYVENVHSESVIISSDRFKQYHVMIMIILVVFFHVFIKLQTDP